MIYTHIEAGDIGYAKDLLSHIPGGLHMAIRATLEQILPEIRSEFAAVIQENFAVKSAVVRKSLTGAILKDGISIRVKGGRLPMLDYHVTPSTVQKRPSGLLVEVRRGNVESYPRGFIMKRGKAFAMRRVSPGRFTGLRSLKGPSVPELAGGQTVPPVIEEYAGMLFESRFYDIAEAILAHVEGGGKLYGAYQTQYAGTRSNPVE